jgi:starch phosphorylase
MDMLVAGAPNAISQDDERTAFSKEALKRAFLDKLFYMQGKFPALATKRD